MQITERPAAPDKAAAKRLIERRLKRLGVTKGELARELALSPSAISRKLGARIPGDVFSERDLLQIARFLDLTASERDELFVCYGYLERTSDAASGASASPSPAAGAETHPQSHPDLPVHLSEFIGRDWEQRQIRDLLETTRLLTLLGAGGIGKTRLAIAVAAEERARYTDGACFVELAALTDGALLPQRVAAVLRLEEAAGRSIRSIVLAHLRERRLLLVLDNCEHLVQTCAEFAEAVLGACPGVRVLATSRERLNVPGEVAWTVPPLTLPPEGHTAGGALLEAALASLLESDAVRLFVERARAARPGFALTTRNAAAVGQICRRLNGVPLALELAAARVRMLTVEQIADRLDDALRLLTGGGRTVPTRQQTLRAALDWSHALLSEPERVLFRRLATFVGGFNIEAAEAVSAWGSIESEPFLDLLAALADKSLLVVDDRGEEARYRQLEPVRQYALERLRAAGSEEETATVRRHSAWCRALVEQARAERSGPRQGQWMSRLDVELENLRAAIRTIEEHEGPGAALARVTSMGTFWIVRGHLEEGRRWLERGAAALTEDTAAAPLRARASYLAGIVAARQGDHAAARAHLEEGLALARGLDDQPLIARTLNGLGMVAQERGEIETARAAYEASLSVQRELGDRDGIAVALGNLGSVTRFLGDFPRAIACLEEALALHREWGDPRAISNALSYLATVAGEQDDDDRAAALHAESLELRRQLGYAEGIAYSLAELAFLAARRGDRERAEAQFAEGMAVAERSNLRGSMAHLLRRRADAALELSTDGAAGLYESALALHRETGNKVGVVDTLIGLATARRRAGDPEQAAAQLDEAIELSREMAYARGIAGAVCGLGYVAAARGDRAEAAARFENALERFRALGSRRGVEACLREREALTATAPSAGSGSGC